jgi:hypothetical protein
MDVERCVTEGFIKMDTSDVERIVCSVLTQYGLDLRLQRVTSLPGGWRIDLRSQKGPVLNVTIHSGSPQAIRCGLMRALNVEG